MQRGFTALKKKDTPCSTFLYAAPIQRFKRNGHPLLNVFICNADSPLQKRRTRFAQRLYMQPGFSPSKKKDTLCSTFVYATRILPFKKEGHALLNVCICNPDSPLIVFIDIKKDRWFPIDLFLYGDTIRSMRPHPPPHVRVHLVFGRHFLELRQ